MASRQPTVLYQIAMKYLDPWQLLAQLTNAPLKDSSVRWFFGVIYPI
jgi:hypothetical protein